jgi:catechol 2,3-dioxygenase-like lactoylglutathione lyase family enzyme
MGEVITVRRVVIDHVDILVRDLVASCRFYEAALTPLDFHLLEEGETSLVFGTEGAEDFGINLIASGDSPTTGAHIAFVAESREAVDAFYRGALYAGGTSKLKPSLHPEYHSGYYAAFVYDPEGNNIEVVFHERPGDDNRTT